MSKILRICACVFALVFVVDNAWAACAASTKRYTSCKSGYYLNGTGAGNSCTSCTTVSATDLSQSCSRSATSTELNNAHAYAGSISGANIPVDRAEHLVLGRAPGAMHGAPAVAVH